MSNKIIINDFSKLIESLTYINKVVDQCKFIITPTGLSIYAMNLAAGYRADLTTNAITTEADTPEITFCFDELSTFIKILSTVCTENKDTMDSINIEYIKPAIHIKSKKVKNKFSTIKEEVIRNNISEKVQTVLTPVLQFITSSQIISQINYHSFIFKDADQARIYLEMNPDLEKNCIYAKIGNKSNDFSNSLTLNLGNIILGKLEDREHIIDFERINIFNIIKSDEIKISLMDKPVLFSEIHKVKDDIYIDLKIYCSLRKA